MALYDLDQRSNYYDNYGHYCSYLILKNISLTELGFSSAVVYHLYKPVAEGNTQKVNAFLNFYKKAYRIIGCIILIVGLLLIPFLPKLIKGSYPAELTLWKLYILYLVNTCVSYFMYAYMTSIINIYVTDSYHWTELFSTKRKSSLISIFLSQLPILL